MPNATQAEPPGISTVFPPAVQRDMETKVRLLGEHLDGQPQLVMPIEAETKLASGNSGAVYFVIKPASDALPGVYPIRVRTDRGISNLRLIQVTDVPVVTVERSTAEYRNGRIQLEEAQPIQWPVVIAGGRLHADADLFRFDVDAGERLNIVTQTRRIGLTPDPVIWLRDAQGRKLRTAHDEPGLRADERLDHTFTESGEYYVELQSFGVAGWNNHYLLRLDDHDYVRTIFPLGGRRGEEVEFSVVNRDGQTSTIEAKVPTDPWLDRWRLPLPQFSGSLPWTLASGDLPEVVEQKRPENKNIQTVSWPVTINGRIEQSREGDRYRIQVKPGQHVRATVGAFYLSSRLDGYLMVYDPRAKKLLAKNDDQAYRGNPDPALTFEVPPETNEVVVELRDTLGRGGIEFPYRLTIEQGGADFSLTLGNRQTPSTAEGDGWYKMDRSDTLNLIAGRQVKLKVSVQRTGVPSEGFPKPIQLKAVGVPAGVTIRPLEVPAGETDAELICTATGDAPREPFDFVVTGQSTRDDGTTIRRVAERKLYLSDPQMPHLSWDWRSRKVVGVVVRK